MDPSSPVYPGSDLDPRVVEELWPSAGHAHWVTAFDYRDRHVPTARVRRGETLGLAPGNPFSSNQASAASAPPEVYSEVPSSTGLETEFGIAPERIVPIQAFSWSYAFTDSPFTFDQYPPSTDTTTDALANSSSALSDGITPVASSSRSKDSMSTEKRRPRKRKRVGDPREYAEDDAENVLLTRRPGACMHCRKGKMKCEFATGENTCKRCKAAGRHCVVEGPKPQSQKEDLIMQIRQKDIIIESLLRQLDSLQPLKSASPNIPNIGKRVPSSSTKTEAFNLEVWMDHFKKCWQPTNGTMNNGMPEKHVDSTGGDSAPVEAGIAPEGSTLIKSEPTPDEAMPLGLISRLSLADSDSSDPVEKKDGEEKIIGWADKTYFKPEPNNHPHFGIPAQIMENKPIPDIVAYGLVTPTEVDQLFNIFFTRMNVHVLLLDPVLHNPSTTFSKSPFLFAVVCAIASRYNQDRPDMYPVAIHFAKHAAANNLVTGQKSIDIVLAYMLLAYYMEPCKRWEDHRTWLYIGVAVRVAVDLKLHQISSTKPATEQQERELLNRSRVWMTCYTLDRSVSTYYGRPFAFKEDRNIRNATLWYKSSHYNSPLDISLCAYVSLLRLTSCFNEEVFSDPDELASLNKDTDCLEVVMRYDALWYTYLEDWEGRFERDVDLNDPMMLFRRHILVYVASYARLVMWSIPFQKAFKGLGQSGDRTILDKCFDIATSIIGRMVNSLARNRYMRYSSDGHYIYATYASGFLVKLLKPRFAPLLKSKQRYQIFESIENLVQVYNSVEMSSDDTHTPRQHARFLSTLLSPYRKGPPDSPQLVWLSPSHVWPASDAQQSPKSSSGQSGSGSGPSDVASTSLSRSTPQKEEPQAFAPPPSTFPPVHEAEIDFDDELLISLESINYPSYWESMVMPDLQLMESGFTQNANPPEGSDARRNDYT